MSPIAIWARAALLAAFTLFLGVAAHVTAGGLMPSVAWLAVLYALALVPCAALLARRASRARIVLPLAGGQALVHLVLTATAGHVASSQAGAAHTHPAGTPAHVDGAGSALETLQYAQAASTPATGDLLGHAVTDAPMMVLHLLAAALVGLWLAVGERSLWAVVDLTGTHLLRPLLVLGAVARSIPTAGLTAPSSFDQPRAPGSVLLLSRSVVRRGPPLPAI